MSIVALVDDEDAERYYARNQGYGQDGCDECEGVGRPQRFLFERATGISGEVEVMDRMKLKSCRR